MPYNLTLFPKKIRITVFVFVFFLLLQTETQNIHHMKQMLMLAATLCLAGHLYAQKAEVNKNGELLSDGKVIATIEKEGCGIVSPTCSFNVYNTDGDLLIIVMVLDYKDPSEVSSGNQDGTVRYLRYCFNGMGGHAELPDPASTVIKPIHAAQSIVKWKLIRDGRLDEEAVRSFIQAYGTRFSERQEALTPQTVIIKDN